MKCVRCINCGHSVKKDKIGEWKHEVAVYTATCLICETRTKNGKCGCSAPTGETEDRSYKTGN